MQIRRLEWDVDAWEDYMYWHMQDKKTLKRINELIKDMLKHPFDGKGKPEPLKRNLQGFWSRRIDGANRIVYAVEDEKVIVIACRNHYDD